MEEAILVNRTLTQDYEAAKEAAFNAALRLDALYRRQGSAPGDHDHAISLMKSAVERYYAAKARLQSD